MTTIIVELLKSKRDGDYNALLRYESECPTNQPGKTTWKSNHVYAIVDPPMREYYHVSDGLVSFVRDYKVSTGPVRNAELFSKEGWDLRAKIKKDSEERIEKRTCLVCLLTCGLAICLCGPCGWCEMGGHELNEQCYISQLKERDNIDNQAAGRQYSFVRAEVKVDLSNMPPAVVSVSAT